MAGSGGDLLIPMVVDTNQAGPARPSVIPDRSLFANQSKAGRFQVSNQFVKGHR